MNAKRVYFIMIGFIGILVLISLAAVFFGNSLLKSKAQKLINYKLDNKVLDEQQTSLAQAKKDIEKYSELEQIAKAVVPQDKDQAEVVREIVKVAGDNGIKLSSISFPASSLGQSTPAPSQPSSSNTTASPLTQVQPVKDIPGIYVLEINIQQDSASPVTYDRFISFLGALEKNRRTAQVTGVTVQPNAQDRSKLTFNLVVNAYIKP